MTLPAPPPSPVEVDPDLRASIASCAERVADGVVAHARAHTSVAVERTVARLFGVEGADEAGVPHANTLVDELGAAAATGIALPLADAARRLARPPAEAAAAIVAGEAELRRVPAEETAEARALADRLADDAERRIAARRRERDELVARLGEGPTPWLYVIVATGDIHEDARQAVAAAESGADVIAVIRSTAQSLLDYVPDGVTSEGFGGTYATQANFRLMRAALDEVGERIGRYVRLTNYCSGLCMPEIAAMGAVERLDMMLNDAMYGIVFRDINMRRTLCDQHFSRMINARAGIVINTGEDNYLTTADGYEAAHTVIASQAINRALARRSGLPDAQIGLGHAFEIDPWREASLREEWVGAMVVRALFPDCPLKYMPPTRHVDGDIFFTHLLDGMFNLVGAATGQHIQLLGMPTEALHTPFLSDRMLSIKNARYVFGAARALQGELQLRPDGEMARRADALVRETAELLEHVAAVGLMGAIGEGVFGDTVRTPDGGRGGEGVFERAPGYANPFLERWDGPR